MSMSLKNAIFFKEYSKPLHCKCLPTFELCFLDDWENIQKIKFMKQIEDCVTQFSFGEVERLLIIIRDTLCAKSRQLCPEDTHKIYRELMNHLQILLLRTSGSGDYKIEPICEVLAHIDSYSDIFQLNKACIASLQNSFQIILKSFRGATHNINLIEYYIKLHLSENLTLEQVAKSFYFNSSYLSTVFAREIGEPFSKYIVNLRLEKAAQMLHDSSASIYNICVLSGFSSDKTFYKQFKKKFGCTPKEYRYFSRVDI